MGVPNPARPIRGLEYPHMSRQPAGSEADLRAYFWSLWRRKWLIAVVTLLVVGAALAFSYHQKPQYTANADVLLQSPTSSVLGAQAGGVAQTGVATQIQIMTSASVQAAVRTKLHAPAPPVNVSEVGQTAVVQISAIADSGPRAADIANDYATAYVRIQQQQAVNSLLSAATVIQSKIDSLDRQITTLTSSPKTDTTAQSELAPLSNQVTAYQGQLDQLQVDAQLASGSAQVVTPATPSAAPSSPKPKRTGALALGVGVLLGCGLALLFEALDDSIRTKSDLELSGGGLPILGVIPVIHGRHKKERAAAVTLVQPMSHGAEAYRQMRTSLQFIHLTQHRQIIQVTSPGAAEGKTTTAVNLAVALVQSGQRVALVDADLRQPCIHEYFGLEYSVGLTTVLLGDAQLTDALATPNGLGLFVLPSGAIPPNPVEILGSPGMAKVLTDLRELVDTVVVDNAPILPVADATALASQVDATLIVVKAGATSRKALGRALELLGQVEAQMSGLIMNAVPIGRTRGYGFGYPYHYTSRFGYGGRPRTEEAHPSSNGLTKQRALRTP